jgi:putative addiction module killer protein
LRKIEIRRYVTETGQDVFGEWLASLRDARARAKVAARIVRFGIGNFGDCRPLREGVWELRVDYGPGYRVYYAKIERACVLLLYGGEKRRQAADIERAVGYWNDYKRRTAKR